MQSRIVCCFGLVLAGLATCAHLTSIASGQDAARPDAIVTQVERGLTGTYLFTFAGKALQAKPQRDTDAPLIVRLGRRPEAGSYELKFMGRRDGVFNLHDYLEHADGSEAKDLPKMAVRIVSTLPQDQRSDLFAMTRFEPLLIGGYRLWLGIAACVWLAIPIAIWIAKVLQTKAPSKPIPEPAPASLGEQLRPLLLATTHGNLTTEEKGQLELLLYRYLRERNALDANSMAETIRSLRTHPEAGPTVQTIEAWLHNDQVQSPDPHRSPENVLQVLEPLQVLIDQDLAVASNGVHKPFGTQETRK